MNLRRLLSRLLLLAALLVAISATLACTPEESLEPRAWIDAPPEGVTVPLGTPITIVSHGYAPEGVTELLLSVNGNAYRRDKPTGTGIFGEVQQQWTPMEPGLYTLQVVTYDSTGASSQPAMVTVRVGQEVAAVPTATEVVAPAAPTSTHTPYPTDTPVATGTLPPTWTPTPSPTGTLPPTWTPTATPTTAPSATPTWTATSSATPIPSPTPTATRPPDIRLWADSELVQAGSCTNVRWHVSEVSAYWIDGQAGAGDDGSFQTCPCQNETHTLRAIKRDGGEVNLSVTIQVQGQCVGAPPAPVPYSPANGAYVNCLRQQHLEWYAVNHPYSVEYYVKMERQVGASWQAVQSWPPLNQTGFDTTLDCDATYRWSVQARDSRGETSNWSAWSQFTIYGQIL